MFHNRTQRWFNMGLVLTNLEMSFLCDTYMLNMDIKNIISNLKSKEVANKYTINLRTLIPSKIFLSPPEYAVPQR